MSPTTRWKLKFLALLLSIYQTSALDCPLGWDGFGNSCYKFVVRSLTVRGLNWENARAVCLGYGGDLVSVANKTEMDFIYNISSRVSNEHYWIGLNYQRNGSTFFWSDGTSYNSTTYNNWRRGEPSDRAKDCVELYHSFWNDDSCKNEYGFICERPRGIPMPSFQPIYPLVTPTPIACPFGWMSYGSSCYKFIKLPKKWTDAKKDCRISGGYLVKIDNANEQYFITLQLRSSSYNMWIGLSDSAHEGTFIWGGDDSLVNFTHWATRAPNNFGGVEDCVEVFSGAMAGFWNDDYCDSEKHYICEMPDGQSLCPVCWSTFGNSCYQFNVHGAQATSWESAEKACTAFKGAELISILNAEEQAFILRELQDMTITQVWLGFNDRKNEGVFKWSDMSAVRYVNWAAHKSSTGSLAAKQDCVVMDPNTQNGTWTTTPCTSQKGYICKRKKGLDQCNSPMGMENGNIGDSQITASSSLNMSLSTVNARFRLLAEYSSLGAWCAAQNKVGEFLQMDLGVVRQITHISLQGRPESDFVRTFYLKYGENGLDFNAYGENATIKYKVLQGNSDAKSAGNVILPEPMHARFVRIYPLTWSSRICLRTEIYGCASQASSKKCGIGWEEGPNNTCYQINSNHWKLWADARATCISRGGDLLSIVNGKEKKWVRDRLTALSGWAYSLWIGLNDRDSNLRWYWSDGSPFKLTSWDAGYPTNKDNIESCVEVDAARGAWRDVSCGEYRPFICKRTLASENAVKIPITGNWISGTDYYWPLDRLVDGKALGTVLATVVGNVTMPDQKQNGRSVFRFEAYNAYLDAGQFTGQCITDIDQCYNGLTVSFVVQFEDGANTWTSKTFIVDTIGDNMQQNNRGFAVYVVNNQLSVTVFSESRKWSVVDTLRVGVWQHVMFTWQQGQGLVLYNDGVKRTTSTYGTTLSPLHSAENPLLVVGSRSSQPTDGVFHMRSLAVWKRELSAKEVYNIFLAEFGSCRLGWKGFGQFCYQLDKARKSWSDARVSCVNHQAELVSIHSPVEQAYINFASHDVKLNQLSRYIWTGLHIPSDGSEFEWSDGSPVQYINWKLRNPDDLWEDEDCVSLFYTNGYSWNDLLCIANIPFICKKRKEYIPSGGSSPTSTVTPGCPAGWQRTPDGSRCFGLLLDRKTWNQARDACKVYGGDLASFHNSMENAVVTTLLVNSWDIADVGGMWIGLTDTAQRGNYEWSDGSAMDYSSWLNREPDRPLSTRSCVRATIQRGMTEGLYWQDSACSDALPYVCATNTTTCMAPLGMESGRISAAQISASSEWDGNHAATQARLYFELSGSKRGGWSSKVRDRKQWLRVDLGRLTNVTRVATQGRNSESQWVTKYKLQYSDDGVSFLDYIEAGQSYAKVFDANKDRDSVVFHDLNPPIQARYIKLRPQEWYRHISMRMELYGCSDNYQAPEIVPTGQCPPGWMHGNGSSCYMMVLQQKTWTAARAYCRALGQGSGQVSIHSLEENAIVASLFNVSLVTAWLGLSGRAIFLGYLWSDESPVQFTNWSPQQPDSHNGQQPCVEMYSTGEWGDTGCYSVKPFICKMPRHVQKQPTITPTTVVTTQSPDICPPGWKLWNSMCYYFGNETSSSVVNWHDARQACQRVKGADLVSIHSSDENEFIKSSIQSYSYDVWIGLNDLGTEASYKWSDGSPLIYTSYAKSEPNDLFGQEECTQFHKFYRWHDMCCSARAPYVCKTHNNSVIPSLPTFSPTNGPVLGRCKEGWVNYDKSCYLVVSDNLLTWQNARDACVNGFNISMHGDLVTVNDQYEQAFLITISLKLKQNLWIGLTHLFYWGFFWADYSVPKYTNWDVKQPNSVYSKKCVSMTYSRDAGRWSMVPCTEENGFICEAGALPLSSNNTGPTSAAPSNRTCPDHYELHGDDCYFVSYVKLTWHEAREACRRESGGDLISVHDPVEQAFVVVNLKHVKGGVWLGLYRETNSTEFLWSDNSLKLFTNWAPNQPNIPRTQITCVVANNSLSNAGLWSDVDCSDRNGFVCRIRKGEPYVSRPLLGSCPDGWEKFEKSCYMFQRTDRQPWTAARLSCQRRGGNLASITSQHEQDFLAFHVGKKEKVPVWIGLNDRALERGYMWSDGSPVTLLNWGPGEPTDTDGSENCVRMLGDGRWIDGGCYSRFGYICKRPLECTKPLGMASGIISSSQLTASSSVDPAYGPAMARLNSLSAWCTKASQHEQSIQVDLLAESRLTEIATQGFYLAGVSSYVTTFKMQTSDDAVAWKTYQKNGKDWVFVANRDATTVTKLALKPAVDTRFVRLLPLSWVNVICLRMELYGCKFACEAPLGMKSGEIRDEFLSASSIIDNSHSAKQARPSGTAWGAKSSDAEPWLEIDFPETEWKISKLTTWGGETGYVTVYRLAYRGDTTNWTDYTEGGRIRNFRGNQDTVSPLSHVLAEPIITQLLRVRPLSWSTSGAYLRLEIFGCQNGCDTALGLTQGVIKDSALSASTSLDQAHAATEGRLNGSTGWCASDKDTKPYLVIDLEGLMRVRKVALQGTADDIAYVKTYTVSFKEHVDSAWKALEKDGKPKVFVANSDSTSVVTNTFASALRVRFIKILPSNWNIRACFRLELYGCPPALQPTVTPPSVFPSGNPATPEDVVCTGSVRLSKEKWTDHYRDSKSDAYKTLAKKLLSAIAGLYYGVDEASLAFKQFEVTGFRPGSIIAMFKLTFYRDMAEDAGVDVKSKLVAAVKSGNLGQLEVDPDSLKLSRDDLKPTVAAKDATAAAARGSSSGLSSGAKAGIAVAVLLVLVVCAAAFAWWYHNNRREKSFSFKYHRNQQVSFSSKTEEAELL